MSEEMVKANGVQIRTESFGDAADEPLLLIMGASAPGVYWPDTFIQKFVDAGRFVVRYDNRDTGKSTCVDYAQHPYTLDDMALDAVAVMDAYGMKTAHVAGASMGGMIVQALMIAHRSRLRTATIIMSSPLAGGATEEGMSTEDLPGPDPEWMAKLMTLAMAPATTREEAIERKVEQFRILAGSVEEFDADAQHRIATIEVDQAVNLDAAMNHSVAINNSAPTDRRPLLAEVNVSTLVIHGTEDPILPYPHGVSLADTIPGAEMMTLERAGHDMPSCYEDDMVARMLALQSR